MLVRDIPTRIQVYDIHDLNRFYKNPLATLQTYHVTSNDAEQVILIPDCTWPQDVLLKYPLYQISFVEPERTEVLTTKRFYWAMYREFFYADPYVDAVGRSYAGVRAEWYYFKRAQRKAAELNIWFEKRVVMAMLYDMQIFALAVAVVGFLGWLIYGNLPPLLQELCILNWCLTPVGELVRYRISSFKALEKYAYGPMRRRVVDKVRSSTKWLAALWVFHSYTDVCLLALLGGMFGFVLNFIWTRRLYHPYTWIKGTARLINRVVDALVPQESLENY
jgi:hypothetical protein